MTWRPPHHDPEVELRDTLSEDAWREPVGLIVARHNLDGSDLFPFPTGSDIVWSAGEHVVKLTAPRWEAEIRAEADGLRRVSGRLGVATPQVLALDTLEGWPYLVMTHVPGLAIGEVWPGLDGPERVRLASDLGRLTRELHGLADATEAGAWPAFWERCTTGVAERHAQRGAPAELAAGIDTFLEEVGPLEPRGFGFLHTELLHDHILVEERGGRFELSGLIDFADSRVGAIDYEFAAPPEFLFRGEPGALRAFLLGYGEAAGDLTAERSRELLAWNLCHQFGHLTRAVRACPGPAPTTLDELAQGLFGVGEA